jgi:hypothetical protein
MFDWKFINLALAVFNSNLFATEIKRKKMTARFYATQIQHDAELMSVMRKYIDDELFLIQRQCSRKNLNRVENKEWTKLEKAKEVYPLLEPMINYFQANHIPRYAEDDEYMSLGLTNTKMHNVLTELRKSKGKLSAADCQYLKETLDSVKGKFVNYWLMLALTKVGDRELCWNTLKF